MVTFFRSDIILETRIQDICHRFLWRVTCHKFDYPFCI